MKHLGESDIWLMRGEKEMQHENYILQYQLYGIKVEFKPITSFLRQLVILTRGKVRMQFLSPPYWVLHDFIANNFIYFQAHFASHNQRVPFNVDKKKKWCQFCLLLQYYTGNLWIRLVINKNTWQYVSFNIQ